MCPSTFFYQVLIVAVVIMVIYSYRPIFARAELNIHILSGLLESPSVKSSYFSRSLEGYYKSRKITWSFVMYDDNYNYLGPCIEPHYVFKKQSFFSITYPKPTQHTILMRNKIYYVSLRSPFKHIDWLSQNIRTFSEQELIIVLEELTQAAEKLEQNKDLNN